MPRFILAAIVLIMLFPTHSAATQAAPLKAALVKNGDLWLLLNEKEVQLTNSGNVYDQPTWSRDGKLLLYQVKTPSEFQPNEQQVEVWAYHIESGKKQKIFYDGYSPTWSPRKDIIAFNAKGILNISDMKRFYNIATGVSDYTWLPDGSGFLLTSSGVLRPDGWTSAMFFTKKVNENYQDIILFGGVEPFFTLPREIGKGDNKIISVYTEQLEYSPSNKWISFIVSPTASWSMDSNMLCVLSSDGKKFEVLDEVIFGVGKPKWAPSTDTIAFIAGGGRIVFGFKNKDLKIREMPASGTFTPPHYADLDFDWMSDRSIVTSRVEEREWSNDFSQHPLPSLYSVDIENNKQIKITHPPDGSGDYNPQFVRSIDKVVWFRGNSITDQARTLWIGNPDGSEAKEWMKNVDSIVFYDGK